MSLDIDRCKKHLIESNFTKLFVEELGWENYSTSLTISLNDENHSLTPIAHKRGFVAFSCMTNGKPPDYSLRRKIERQVSKSIHEHIIIFIDKRKSVQIWQWVKREVGKPSACREHIYYNTQPGDSLIQKLQNLAFNIEEEEKLTIVDVSRRTRIGFDVERVTKRFYDRFKTEHTIFLKFLAGIPNEEMERWYVSVMLNRLMFVYFIQKKGFLNNDRDYLKNKLAQCKKELGKDRYYRDFLCPLFFEGFAKQKGERSDKAKKLLGEVPYLNGGIFMPHQIEQLHGKTIAIPDKALEKLFEFFDAYQWHLDERPLRKDDEINPDVLGYIFEKYINQKQMGAYYSKEDITEYISKNTVIPFLFDAAREKCKVSFEGKRSIWQLLQEDPDRYIYPSVRHGVEVTLPLDITAGITSISNRNGWNKSAPAEYALPTEIWREVVTRRKHYEEVRGKLAAGEINSINNLITYNLDIRQFAQDVVENCEGPELLMAFWKAIEKVTVLDPTCGSGAFLFAALNILDPLYEACMERMSFFLEEWGNDGKKNHPNYHKFFTETLKRVEDHPNHRYFVLKSIIVNNLYGVDIMEEAIEICKLRLFLKLVAQIEHVQDIEPLPDIDFNIRVGNTLVGFTSTDEVRKAFTEEKVGEAVQGKLLLGDSPETFQRFEEKVELADRAFRIFREMQTKQGMKSSDFAEAKENLRSRLRKLTDELDRFLAGEYGVDTEKKDSFEKWQISHQPFHWFAEFYDIIKNGGFDIIIGNPPYVEYNTVADQYAIRNFITESCGNLYAFIVEKSFNLASTKGRIGLIVPISLIAAQRMATLQELMISQSSLLVLANYGLRPAALFPGVMQRLTIFITSKGVQGDIYTSEYITWYAEERVNLFAQLKFFPVDGLRQSYSIPKANNSLAHSTLSKILSKDRPWKHHNQFKGEHCIFYHNAGGYWIKTFNFKPFYKSLKDPEKSHTTISELHLPTASLAFTYLGVLNSSLFYFFWKSLTDARHVYPSDIAMLPIDLPLAKADLEEIRKLGAKLMAAFMKHRKRIVYGDAQVDQFSVSPTKPILDEIDRLLAKHYGFTAEELDFILNYDIKYRMGAEMDEEDDQD